LINLSDDKDYKKYDLAGVGKNSGGDGRVGDDFPTD